MTNGSNSFPLRWLTHAYPTMRRMAANSLTLEKMKKAFINLGLLEPRTDFKTIRSATLDNNANNTEMKTCITSSWKRTTLWARRASSVTPATNHRE